MTDRDPSAGAPVHPRPMVPLSPCLSKPGQTGSDPSMVGGAAASLATSVVVLLAVICGVAITSVVGAALTPLTSETAVAITIAGLVMLAAMTVAIRIIGQEAHR